MKKFAIVVLITIFTVVIASSGQSIYADHSEPGQGIWHDDINVNVSTTQNSKYQIYLQVEVRNIHGQLVSVSESMISGFFIPHKITDEFFDERLGKKETIVIDNIKYEKVQYTGTISSEELFSNKDAYYHGLWAMNFCIETDGHGYKCIPIFQTNTAYVLLEKNDTTTNHWTILKELS